MFVKINALKSIFVATATLLVIGNYCPFVYRWFLTAF